MTLSEDKTTSREKPKRRRSLAQTAKIIDAGGRIFELRKSGASWRSISSVLVGEAEKAGGTGKGFSFENCRLLYNEYVEILLENGRDNLDAERERLLGKIDDLYLNYQPYTKTKISALSSHNELEMKKKAGDICAKLIHEEADILGVKKPQKMELSGEGGSPLVPVVTPIIIEFTMDVHDEKE